MKYLIFFLVLFSPICQADDINNLPKNKTTLKYKSDSVKVVTIDYTDKLYINNKPTDIEDRFLSVYQIIPTPDNLSNLYLVEATPSGTGTSPYFIFISIFHNGKHKISKDIFGGGILSVSSVDNRVIVKMEAQYKHIDHSLMQPRKTFIFSNGKITEQ